MSTNALISKVWSFCNTLRDDGVGYGDYLEQLTCQISREWYHLISRERYQCEDKFF